MDFLKRVHKLSKFKLRNFSLPKHPLWLQRPLDRLLPPLAACPYRHHAAAAYPHPSQLPPTAAGTQEAVLHTRSLLPGTAPVAFGQPGGHALCGWSGGCESDGSGRSV